MTALRPEGQRKMVRFGEGVMRGIAAEVQAALATAPACVETGGILLGRNAGRSLTIEDFEPVLCEHRFGPTFVLSEEDLRQFHESLEWFGTQRERAGDVVGIYRSQLRPDATIGQQDREWIERLLPAASWLLLMVRPDADGGLNAEMIFHGQGRTVRTPAPAPFPFAAPFGVPLLPADASDASPAAEVAATAAKPAPGTQPEPILAVPPTSRPAPDLFAWLTSPPQLRRWEADAAKPAARAWFWPLAVTGVTVAAGILGYASVDPAPPAARRAEPASSQPIPVSPPPAAPAPAPPAALPNANAVESAVREALDQWIAALKSGDVDEIAALYAPRLPRYFKLRNATTADVRNAVSDSLKRFGRPAILRLTDVKIEPLPDGRATATFHKHWQTGGPKVFAGEEQERLELSRVAGEWKIDSEEELRVLWVQRPD